jgi:CheY-like chemotaxis protein
VESHRATTSTLHHAQKIEALGQLTGGIAHDFNNLLMAVLGSLALLRKRLPAGDERSLRLLDNAVQGANRGAALTQRLLTFSRRQAVRPEVVELPALVEGMSDLLRRSLGPGYRLETRLAPGLPPVLVDPGQLELAVLNLALNARDALPGGGGIEISARVEVEGDGAPSQQGQPPEGHAGGDVGGRVGGHVVLAVTDHGEGMDAATLARAAEPFFTTKGAGKGTGLGLAMVQGLAVQSGGRLELRSTQGVGTVAELWLRRAEAVARPGPDSAAVAPAATPSRRLSVLVVDDDPLVLASAGAMLEDLGHRAVEAEDGERALARLRAGAEVDLVITDYGMPGMSGLQLAEELRRLRPGLPVLLATGYGEVPALDAAGLGRLSKPFGQPTLSAAIEAAFAGPG